jgi:hypothetical protein
LFFYYLKQRHHERAKTTFNVSTTKALKQTGGLHFMPQMPFLSFDLEDTYALDNDKTVRHLNSTTIISADVLWTMYSEGLPIQS